MKLLKFKVFSVLFLSLLLAFFGCDGEDKSEIQRASDSEIGGTIVLGETGEVSTLIPVLVHDSASSSVAGFLYDGLVKSDEDPFAEPVPHIAKSWEWSEDGLTLTVYMKDYEKFHDGHILTAEDVKFTFDCIKNPETLSNYKTSLEKFESCEVVDEFTVRFHLSTKYCPALRSIGFSIMPAHLFTNTTIRKDNKFGEHPIGSGPYMLERWDPGKLIVLRANPNYKLSYRGPGRFNIDRIAFLYFGDNSTLTFEFLAGLGRIGSVDLVPIQPQYLKKWRANPRINVQSYSGLGYGYFGFNLRKGKILSDKLVRQAICHAVNRDEMIDLIYQGDAKVLNGPIHPLSKFFSSKTRVYDFNPEKAKLILEEAGWVDSDGDGIRDKDGKKLSLILRTYTGYEITTQRCVLFQSYLKKVGIDVVLSQKEWSTFIKLFDKPDDIRWDVVTLGWGLGYDPDSDLFTTKSIRAGGNNIIGFRNPKIDELIEIGRVTCDFEDRFKIYEEYQIIISEEAPYLFLWTRDSHLALNLRFKGIDTKDILGVFYHFEDWSVPPELRKY
ncbi:MAG: hypothetical protein ISS23_00335 [Nanoarchaeota archaeon]|nr:hypothetical protein [Nanoarchaeota archaeon]